MKTNRVLLAILAGALAFGGIVACGDETTDPGTNDGGSGGTDVGTGGTGGAGGGTGGTGGDECVNHSLTCDDCAKWEKDPLNACADSTEDCVPFDNEARVPGWPNVPKVN